MKKTFLFLLCLCGASLWAECSPAAKIVIDGKLDEPSWQKAKKESGFTPVVRPQKKVPELKDRTEFSVLQDENAVYFGITCYEKDMKGVLNGPVTGRWANEAVEIFLSPSGHPMSFYQFLITLNNATHAEYYDEFGVTKPDPLFGPVWESAVFHGNDFWSVEVRIPLSAFNMTRCSLWSSKWKLNVARNHRKQRIFASWSKLSGEKGFQDPKCFRDYTGFPMKRNQEDFQIRSAAVKIRSSQNGVLQGVMDVDIHSPLAGMFLVQLDGKNARRAQFKKGDNMIQLPCSFKAPGKPKVRLGVQINSSSKAVERFYPVTVAYDPLKITLSSPAYRNNFYPGQKFDKIRGHVESAGTEPVKLTLTGPGIGKQEKTLPASGDFEFDTAKLEIGTATLEAVSGKEHTKLSIRRLAPSKHMMSWIENGNLVINGKPTLRRSMYATFYRGGEAFKERYLKDNLYETPECRLSSGAVGRLEPNRLVRGIEAKEGVRDVKPSQKLFDALDKAMEQLKDQDFPYYYISDEPECRGVSPVYLKHIYDYVAAKDPYHVILSCSRSTASYIDCADWFETHPYINPHQNAAGKRVYGREINTLGNFVDAIAKQNRPDKCIGFCPTIFSYSLGDTPTFPEIVCHTYAGMIHGGKTLFPYAYHDLGDRPALYEGTRYIFSSFGALQDFFLFGTRRQLARTEEYEAVLFTLGQQKMLVIVNFTPKEQKAVLPEECGKFLEFRGTREIRGKEFTLAPHEVLVGTTKKLDAGLPTYAETNALVDKLEAERVNRGNLLMPLASEVIVSTSNTAHGIKKMFDGTLDVYAWGQTHKGSYYEIAFPDTIPTFSKLRIHGKGVKGAVLTMRKRGEWQKPVPAETKHDKYMVEYRYEKPLRSVKLRIDFPAKSVELYEIELLK